MQENETLLEEVSLILFLLEKDNFTKYFNYIKKLNLEVETKKFLTSLSSYFKDNEEVISLSVEEFLTYFAVKHPALRVRTSYVEFMEKLGKIKINSKVLEENLNNFLEKYFASEIVFKLTEVLDGVTFNVLDDVQEKIAEFNNIKVKLNKDEDELFVSTSLKELLDEEVHKPGLKWRLKCLNQDIGDLRGASLGHVFARVDTGKTSFLVSEITNFASQIEDDEIILWCNNEEKGTKVNLRLYSAALKCTKKQLVEYSSDAEAEYTKLGGNKIRIYDEAIISVEEIDQLCSEYKVRLLVIDQGDKVTFQGDHGHSSVEKLKIVYGKFRELAKKYDIPVIAVGQASVNAIGTSQDEAQASGGRKPAKDIKYLQLNMMDNSKTGKPGELDYAIGIGQSQDDVALGIDHIRYISICKNKMKNGIHGQHVVEFDSQRALYTD